MELVYPVYTDIIMMQAFLASLEGGLQDDAFVEDKKTGERAAKAAIGARAGLGNLLSWLTSASASVDIDGNIKSSNEQIEKYTRKFPSEALFIRLRNLLLQEGLIKQIAGLKELEKVRLGDLVEITGKANAEPRYKLETFLNQIAPLLSEFSKLNQKQMEAHITLVKNAKVGETIMIESESVLISDKQKQNVLKVMLETKKSESAQLMDQYASFSLIMKSLMPDPGISSIIFDCNGFYTIARVYDTYVRNERIDDIHNASWRCIGKVIDISEAGTNLLLGMPIGYVAKDAFSELTEIFSGEDLSVDMGDSHTNGKTIVLAVLAIFS